VRYLVKTSAIISLLLASNVYSLGVGNLRLHSKLYQPLQAEIPLIASADEDLSTLQVRLASPDKFDKAGVEWTPFLSKIKFTPIVKSNGASIIRVRSNDVVTEPFLNFLVEVYSKTGVFYREFTLLIDPPSSYVSRIQAPIQENKKIIVSKRKNSVTTKRVKKRKTPNSRVKNQYGPTKSTDFIWKIAAQLNKERDVSIEQMIMALFQANPQAFYKDNVNALKKKQTLKIPAKKIILGRSKKEALTALNQQNLDWKSRSAVSESVEKPSVVSKKSENKTASPAKKAPLTALASDDNSLLLAKLNKVLNRLNLLEQQVGTLQETVASKNEEIAELKGQTKSPFSLKISAGSVDDEIITAPEEDEILAQEDVGVGESESIESTDEPLPETELKNNSELIPTEINQTSEAIQNPALVENQSKSITQQGESKNRAAVTLKKTDIKNKTKVISEQQGLDLSVNYWTLILTAFLAVGLLGWFWGRRKQGEEISAASKTDAEHFSTEFEEEIVEIETKDTGFLQDVENFDAEEEHIDPIVEADVYLNYEYYPQAEGLIRRAIEDYPERDDCKLKLLEILYKAKNVEGFEAYITELTNLGKHNQPDFWINAVRMGIRLNPESALYTKEDIETAGVEIEVAEEDESTESVEETIETKNEPSSFETVNEVVVETEDASDEFDFSSFDEEIDLDEASVEHKLEEINTDNLQEENFELTIEDSAEDIHFEVFQETDEFEILETETAPENNLVDFEVSLFDEELESTEDSFEILDIEDDLTENNLVEFDLSVADNEIDLETKIDINKKK